MDDKLITIKSFPNEPLASMAQQILEDNGIKSIMSGENVASIYLGLSDVFDIDLQVCESDAEKAFGILESIEKSEED